MTYTERILKAVQNGMPTPLGTVCVSEVRHDDWCKKLVTGTDCNCDPDILLQIPDGRFRVLPDDTFERLG